MLPVCMFGTVRRITGIGWMHSHQLQPDWTPSICIVFHCTQTFLCLPPVDSPPTRELFLSLGLFKANRSEGWHLQ
jgi:hypothetical protein